MNIAHGYLVPALLLLGACGMAPDIASEGGRPVACALQGAEEFSAECRLVETVEGNARTVVMRHPDGGFRKLAPADNPAGLVELDGAQQARSWREGDDVVLIVGDDRYRWEEPADD